MTQQEVIKAFMKSFDTTTKKGEAALNEAIKACSTFNSFQELKTAIINDCKNAKSADDFLKTYCGIDLDNDDTGAITGKDAGGATVKTASSIVPEEGSLYEFDKGNWFNDVEGQDGLIVKLAKRTGSLKDSNNVVERDFSELFNDELSNKQEIYLWRSVYKWWIRNGLALISESYGNNFSFDKENSSATNKDRTIYIIFEYFEDSDALADTWGGPSHNQKSTNNLIIRINLKYHDEATGKDGVNEYEHLDRTIAHELTHAVMRANIDYFDYLPALIKEGVAELTHDIDDVRTDDIKKLAADSNLLSQALVLDEETIDVSGIHSPTYAGGYMFLRYLARQAGDLTIENSSDSIVRTFRGNDSINNTRSKTTITSGTGSDTVYNYGASVSIDAGTGNDFISNEHANKVTIISGTGDDTVWNWSSDDTKATGVSVSIDAGTGNDYIWNDGNNATISGGTGSDTVNNYGSNVKVDGGTGDDSIRNGEGSYVSMDGGAGNDFLYNASLGSNISMLGGTGNDTIWNWGANITIEGGTGNDSIATSGANILFKYAAGDGNDAIYGFNETSTLQIGNGTTDTYSAVKSGNNVIVTVGTGKITLLGAASLSSVNINPSYNPTSSTLTLTNSSSSKVTLASKYELADASKRSKAIRIVGNAKDNSILGGTGNDTLYGKDGADYLVGNAGNDKLYGQNDDDTLWGGAGNDTLIGGDGNDLFIHSTGKDLIYDYAAGDRISLGSAISKAMLSGSNVVLTTGKGTLTVKGGKSKTLSLITSTGKELSTIIGSDKVTYTDSSAAKVTLSSTYTTADASKRSKAIRIVGNAKDNSILGGSGKDTLYGKDGNDYIAGNAGNDKLYGQNGNDTLWGGAGNDTLTGGEGADTFLYNAGDGKDVITDFANDDMLQISGTFSAKYYASSDKIIFKVGSTASAITLKDFTAYTFNINGNDYIISGSKLVKR